MADHAKAAQQAIDEAKQSVAPRLVDYYLAVAQVHATLEVAAAIRSLKEPTDD